MYSHRLESAIGGALQRYYSGEPMGFAITNASKDNQVDSSDVAYVLNYFSSIRRKLQSKDHIEKAMDFLYEDLDNTRHSRTERMAYEETADFIICRAVEVVDKDSGDRLIGFIKNTTIPFDKFHKIWVEKKGYGLQCDPEVLAKLRTDITKFKMKLNKMLIKERKDNVLHNDRSDG